MAAERQELSREAARRGLRSAERKPGENRSFAWRCARASLLVTSFLDCLGNLWDKGGEREDTSQNHSNMLDGRERSQNSVHCSPLLVKRYSQRILHEFIREKDRK